MRSGVRIVAVLVVCVAWVAGSSTTALASRPTPTVTGSGTSLLGNPLALQSMQPLIGAQQVIALRQVALDNPEAVWAREASRTEYEGLNAGTAAKVARESFPEAIGKPADDLSMPHAGERIVGYPDDHAAQIDLGNGKHTVVESMEPIAMETSSGHHEAIDLTLAEAGEGFQPKRSDVGLHIPKHLSSGIRLPGSGVSLTPINGQGGQLEGAEGVVDGATVLYANTQTDSDTLIKPVTSGFEADTLLRSVNSPSQIAYRVGLPAGARLVPAKDKSGDVDVLAEGTVIAVIAYPSAVDADGVPVMVTMSISGDDLLLSVNDRSSEYRYPIDVDPTVLESGQGGFHEIRYPTLWKFYSVENPSFFQESAYEPEAEGLSYGYEDYISGTVAEAQHAFFYYKTQGLSRIYETNLDAYTDLEPNIENVIGIWNVHSSKDEASQSWRGTGSGGSVCSEAGCATGTVTTSNDETEVFDMQYAREAATYLKLEYYSRLQSGTLSIVQEAGPSNKFDTTDAEIEGKPNGLYAGKWVSLAKGPVDVGAMPSDPGTGIKEVTFWSTVGTEDWGGILSGSIFFGCNGAQCDETVSRPASESLKLGELPDGEDPLESKVTDPVGLTATAKATIKLDSTPPHTLTLTGLPAGNEIGYGYYRLKLGATDGSGTTPSSGVASLTLSIDGKQIGSPAGYCSPGPCTASSEWVINGEEFVAGNHTITVTATDNAGNVAKEEFPLVIHSAESKSVGPGSVELGSGALTLNSTDVSVASPGASLTVIRSYNSRRVTTGGEGPLGPQWSGLSVSGFQNLTKLANGSVVLTASNGMQSLFTKESSKYVSPSGDSNLVLKEETSTKFTLTDQSGNVTTFTEPTGGSGTILTPSRREQPGSTHVITYTYQTVSGVTEPTEALAPVASGLTCTTLVKGCRALTFTYSTSTTAKGEAPSEWGEYTGRLAHVSFTAWEPTKKEMLTTTVAQYSYDAKGRLRAEWNPQISPALKTTYGYDAEGHVTAVSGPGQQPWFFNYGMVANDTHPGRLMSVVRPAASTAFGSGSAPANTELPKLSTTTPTVGAEVTVTTGTWSNSPGAYAYQWERCNSSGAECSPILGAINPAYTVRNGKDEGHALVVRVTATNSGGSTVVSTATGTIVPVGIPQPSYHKSFGTAGTGELQFKSPEYIAIGKHVEAGVLKEVMYVTDTGNNRVERLSMTGGYLAKFGETGTRELQFKEPTGIAAGETTEGYDNENVLIADSGNKRYQRITDGEYFLTSLNATRTGALGGVAIGSVFKEFEGTNVGGNITEEMTLEPEGSIFRWTSHGGVGTGNGQFKEPTDLAWDPVSKYWYVTDAGNNRVQYFNTSWVYEGQFGEVGAGNGQLKGPKGITVDAKGNLWVVDTGNNRVQEFTSSGTYMTQFKESFKSPMGIVIAASGNIYVVDTGDNRIEEWLPGKIPAEEALPAAKSPALGTSAVTSIEYGVPVSGTGAPHSLTSTETATWGQTDNPVEATAIFPPDEPVGWPAADYKRATIYYRDNRDRTVNVASPSGAISTAEYNTNNDVTRTLSADNRATALKEGAKSVEVSKLLDNESTYNSEGTELQSTLGPKHTIKLASGKEVEARSHTINYYNEGAPTEGGPYALVTKTTQGAQIEGEAEQEIRTTTTSYSGQSNLGWKLRRPTSVTTDPSGLKLTYTTQYSSSTGSIIESRTPASTGEGNAHDTKMIYYSVAANSEYPACGEHPEWANLLCQTRPGAQPGTAGLPELPVTTITYSMLDDAEKTTETVGSVTRTKTVTYDTAGRPLTSSGSSTVGTSLPAVTYEYNKETGALVTLKTSSPAKSITSVFNSLGELTSYTDADENTATYTYDIDGRVEKTSDGKGSQTYTYDPTTGIVTKLVDSAAGTFTATYDIEGNLLTEGLPNGMNATYTRNQEGAPTKLEYIKTTHCTENCVWFSDAVVPSIHGQWLSQASSLSSQKYTYDEDGRLTQVQNTPVGKGCTTRIYEYDADTNRLSLTTRGPNAKNECAKESETVEKHTYDSADRLLDSGTKYNEFGDVTNLPAADAGGSELTSTFYVDNQLASQTQNGQTIGYNLDPTLRTREIVSTGKTTATVINHYDGPGSSPAWTSEASGKWTRNISGIASGLGAVQYNGESPVLQLTNLHGDVIATASLSETATGLASTADTTEYGVPATSAPPKYSWLGEDEVPTELPSGVIGMGARSYVPQLGRFLQPDPIPGGSADAYTYAFGDPVNTSDPSGAYTIGAPSQSLIDGLAQIADEGAAEQAAINAAAREEAERKAEEAANIAANTQGGEEAEGEEYEEYEEEEGGEEYASYKHEKGSNSEDTHIESVSLLQSFNGEEAPITIGSTASACVSGSEGPCTKNVVVECNDAGGTMCHGGGGRMVIHRVKVKYRVVKSWAEARSCSVIHPCGQSRDCNFVCGNTPEEHIVRGTIKFLLSPGREVVESVVEHYGLKGIEAAA